MMATSPAPIPAPILKLRAKVEEIARKLGSEHVAIAAAPALLPSSVRRTVGAGLGRPTLHFTVQISGEVIEDCRATTEPVTGIAKVTVLLQQPNNCLPVLATRRYDANPSSHDIARSVARRLRAGTTVHVSGKAMALATHQGMQVLQVLDVQTLEPPPEPTTRKDLE